MRNEIKDHTKREVRVTIERTDQKLTRDAFCMKTTGYGEVVNLDELLIGLVGRVVKVTVETE